MKKKENDTNAIEIKDPCDWRLDSFLRHPVWKMVRTGLSRARTSPRLFTPFESQGPLDPTQAEYRVRVHITYADGSKGYGCVKPYLENESDLAVLCPILLHEDGQSICYQGIFEPDEHAVTGILNRLGKTLLTQVFPLIYRTDVALVGGERSLVVPGFTWVKYRMIDFATEAFYQNPVTQTRESLTFPIPNQQPVFLQMIS